MANMKEEDKSDPIKASYDIFIKPNLSNGQKLYVLQFPNRSASQPYTAEKNSQPLELRTKPKSGLIEVDVPVDVFRNYDREKGIKWGDALKQTNATKGETTYGLPGGFGIGAQPGGGGRGRGRPVKDEPEDFTGMSERAFTEVLDQQRVLVKQTLGGQAVAVETSSPQYMIGAFRQNQLHLTPVSHIVQLRPQFHHIDAKADLERQSRPRDPAAGPPAAARAIHMTAKVTADGEEAHVDTMVERIRLAQEELWRKLKYVDENSAEAWNKFEKLFVDTNPIAEEEEAATSGSKSGAAVAGIAKLQSSMSNEEYLNHIGAPRVESKPKKTKRKRKTKKEEGDGAESSITLSDDDVEMAD